MSGFDIFMNQMTTNKKLYEFHLALNLPPMAIQQFYTYIFNCFTFSDNLNTSKRKLQITA